MGEVWEDHNPAVFSLRTGMKVVASHPDGSTLIKGTVTETGFSPLIGEFVEIDRGDGDLVNLALSDKWTFAQSS